MTSSRESEGAAREADTAQAGDWIEVAASGEGSPRRGEILEVLGEDHHLRFHVRWDEEHESLFYPSAHHFVVHRGRSRITGDG